MKKADNFFHVWLTNNKIEYLEQTLEEVKKTLDPAKSPNLLEYKSDLESPEKIKIITINLLRLGYSHPDFLKNAFDLFMKDKDYDLAAQCYPILPEDNEQSLNEKIQDLQIVITAKESKRSGEFKTTDHPLRHQLNRLTAQKSAMQSTGIREMLRLIRQNNDKFSPEFRRSLMNSWFKKFQHGKYFYSLSKKEKTEIFTAIIMEEHMHRNESAELLSYNLFKIWKADDNWEALRTESFYRSLQDNIVKDLMKTREKSAVANDLLNLDSLVHLKRAESTTHRRQIIYLCSQIMLLTLDKQSAAKRFGLSENKITEIANYANEYVVGMASENDLDDTKKKKIPWIVEVLVWSYASSYFGLFCGASWPSTWDDRFNEGNKFK